MKQLLYSILLLSLLALPDVTFGQRNISGKVTDAETGEGLIGATVQVVGTSRGAVTGIDGDYTVVLPDGSTEVRFSYSGYAEQILAVGASNNLDVSLQPNTLLQEVLIIGYGTVKRDDATGSIQTVTSETFNQGAINSAQELIVGKIAGVQVTPSSDPGGGSAIRIRGGSSLSASNDPLIVIDGVPVDNNAAAGSRNALNLVNPNDIESFTVLKDASATAIYGSRASNGVILITTKKGNLGKKIGVDFNANVSFSDRINQIDALSADQFRALVNAHFADGHPARSLMGNANTDWQKEIYQIGIGQDLNLALAGGVGAFPYRVSLGYTNRNGILKTDNFQRSSAALNLSPKFLDSRLQFNINVKGILGKNQFANRGAIGSAVFFDPTQPVEDQNSPYGGYFTWTQADGTPNPLAPANPLALINLHDDQSTEKRLLANAQVDYRFAFLPDLRFNLNVGTDRSSSEGSVEDPANASYAFVNGGYRGDYSQTKKNDLLEAYANYIKKIGNSSIDLMGGYSWQHFYFEDYAYNRNLDESKIFYEKRTIPREYFLLSLFGRVNINIGSRLLLTGTVRQDATSRFGADNRKGLFPAAAIAYKLIEERDGMVSSLKLRLGYGETGQQDVGSDYYPYLARYLSSLETAQYQFGDQFYTTLRPGGYNANLKWEQTATYNAGLDYGLFDSRIYGSLDVYLRKTTDLLNFVPVPAGTNLTNFLLQNVGDLENRGVELSINADVLKNSQSSWTIGANVTVNQNKITRLTATDQPNYPGVYVGGISGGVGNTVQIHSVGYPASSFYLYQQVYDEAGKPIEGLFTDINGDGQITPDDRYRYDRHTPNAIALIGFYSNYTHGKWDLAFAGRANVGNYIYNNVASNSANYNGIYSPTNYINNVSSEIYKSGFTVPQYFSDYFVQNASFLRIDHITLGRNFAGSGRIQNLRLWASVQNPFTVTNYKGLDPEVFGGIDNNIYPRSRTYVVGLNANL